MLASRALEHRLEQAGADQRPRGGAQGSEATDVLSMWPVCEALVGRGGGGGVGTGIPLTYCVLNQFNGSFRRLRFDFFPLSITIISVMRTATQA